MLLYVLAAGCNGEHAWSLRDLNLPDKYELDATSNPVVFLVGLQIPEARRREFDVQYSACKLVIACDKISRGRFGQTYSLGESEVIVEVIERAANRSVRKIDNSVFLDDLAKLADEAIEGY